MTTKIPQSTVFSEKGRSDLLGNIHYTKNMNFSEEGYAKLSSRSVSIISEKNDSNFDIPISYGRLSGGYNVVSGNKPYIITPTADSISIAQDTDLFHPQLSIDSWGVWWQNRWHVVADNNSTAELWYKSGNLWTDCTVSGTTGVVHAIEVFKNRNTLCMANGNVVKQLDTSYSTSGISQLTLPTDYEVVGISYSNNKVGIITKLSDTVAGQNQEALFFVWDGATSSANAGFPVGSDTILGVWTYKSSWIILNRKGQVLYFTGGGFEELCRLPFYQFQATLGDSTNRITFGNVIDVQGDDIYFNMANGLNAFGTRKEVYYENNPAGILCYSPSVGLHHRYSPSISPLTTATANQANVDTTTGIITINSSTVPDTGSQVMLTRSTSLPIGGLVAGTAYWVIKASPSSFKVATSRQNAIDGNFVTLTSQGDTTSTFAFLTIYDFGSSLNQNRVGGIAQVLTNTQLYDHLFFGGEYDDYGTSSNYSTICVTIPQFENRGYLVTSKIVSSEIEDDYKKIFIKYRPLDTNDKIIVKYKNTDILNLPVTTPQIPNLYICQWTSTTTFTTSADLSVAYNFWQTGTPELECEIINGAGAGCMEQVSNITYSTGVYTVTLENSIIGASNGYYCNVIINNWIKLGEIDSTDTKGYKEFSISKASKWAKVKIEFRGSNTTLEEAILVNAPYVMAER